MVAQVYIGQYIFGEVAAIAGIHEVALPVRAEQKVDIVFFAISLDVLVQLGPDFIGVVLSQGFVVLIEAHFLFLVAFFELLKAGYLLLRQVFGRIDLSGHAPKQVFQAVQLQLAGADGQIQFGGQLLGEFKLNVMLTM